MSLTNKEMHRLAEVHFGFINEVLAKQFEGPAPAAFEIRSVDWDYDWDSNELDLEILIGVPFQQSPKIIRLICSFDANTGQPSYLIDYCDPAGTQYEPSSLDEMFRMIQ